MSEIYSRRLRDITEQAAEAMGAPVARGVYLAVHGPSYETPAEILAFRALGADAVGMSTAPEAIAARHAGLEVLGISCITNMAAGVLPQPLKHDEVMETARRVRGRSSRWRPSLPVSKLVAAARRGRKHARADYSRFRVGAALETGRDHRHRGNIENATYGLTICAERVAMFKAPGGPRRFRRIAVVASTNEPTPPCGPCRQILWEFGGNLEVVFRNLRRVTARMQLKDLLLLPFDRRRLAR